MMRIQMRASVRAPGLAIVAVVAILGTAACSDTPTTPSTQADGSRVIGQVHVAPEAVVLAAGGTQQLSTTVTALDGAPLTAYGAAQYVSLDSSKVTVSATGLVTARTGSRAMTEAPVGVTVTVTENGVTQSDTAYFAVVETVGSVPTFSMADASSGTKVGVGSFKSVTPSITYFNGTSTVTLEGSAVPVKIHIGQPTLARRASESSFKPIASEGAVTVSATTVVFGTPLTDSVTYTLGNPISFRVSLSRATLGWQQYSGGNVTASAVFYLQPGGQLTLINFASIDTHTVGFTCTATDGGVAPPPVTGMTSGYSMGFMTFTVPGRYACDWTSDGIPDFPTDGSLHFTIVVQ